MTPEELDKLEALAAEERRLDRECVEAGRHADYVGARRLALASDAITRDLSARLLDAAPALIAAAREVDRLRDLVRHQRGPLHDAGLITDAEYAELAGDAGAVLRLAGYDAARAEADRLRATVDAQTAIIVDLKAEKAGLELDVERLRAFVPVWRREDEHTLHLTLGPVALGGVMGPHPESGLWGAMATGDDGVTEHPDLPTAARAVCARLGIPSVEVGDAR